MKQINCTVDSQDYAEFQKRYPQCLSRFIRNVLKLAINDSNFFKAIFFGEIKDGMAF